MWTMLLAMADVAPPPQPTSTWEVIDQKSELDGRRSLVATKSAVGFVSNIIDRPEQPVFGFTCDKNGLYVTVHWPDFVQKQFADDLKVNVSWKVDDGAVQHAKWVATEQSVAMPGRPGMAWFHSLAGARRLVVSIPDRHGGQEAVFDLSGISDVDSRLQAMTCG